MAKTSNKHKVSDCLDLLRDALAPYVRRQLKLRYHEAWFDRGVENTLAGTLSIQQFKRLQDEEEKYATLDLQALLNIMERRWNDVFAAVLERKARSYIAEIREYRNQLAHQGRFTIHDACRAIETIYLLMQMVSPTNVDAVREIMQQIRQEQFRKDEQAQLEAQMVQINSHPYLKSWREIARPHDDVAQGHFNPEEYAVDLSQVVNHEAAVEYQNPHEFFRRTYLTQGLRDLLEIAIQRLTGKRTSPVIQLQTAFGGGKTHTMLALYHLFGGEFELSALTDLQELVESVIHDDLPIANRAVIVGTQFSAFEPRHYPDGIKTHTIWGDIAYQLGGKEGYELVRKEDEHAISPSSEKMMHLFERFGPALVLIDEWVAFARNLYGKSDLPCGSFDSNLTFVQALTEGAKRSSDALVVASIPESDIEMGGEGGQAAREKLEHAFGRLETIWRPASQEESMEIVRRRLFKEIDEVQRNAVIEEFMTLYQSHRKEFPNETHLHEYRQKMRIAYPIHPELFARLYEDWSTLDRFQRTRGILRLMAMMIHRLWVGNDHSLMIMPSTVPLDLASVSAELTKYLPSSGWDTMLDADVDGKNSRAFRIDVENPHFGKCSAARRVARTIFIGSVAKDNKKNNRGIDESRVRLGCVQPQENVILFNDAMRRLQEELTYLYTEHKRYWFDKQPSLNRLALERAELLDESVDVMPEIIRRLEALSQQHRFEFVNVYPAPDKSREVPDEQAVSLVILPPDRTYRKGIKDNKAEVYAEEVLLNRRCTADSSQYVGISSA